MGGRTTDRSAAPADTNGSEAPPVGAPADAERYTIDELAAATGVPSRTIRFYQSKGALPSPERRGRVAYYADLHVERLRLIAELQDRGLRLDAIRDVVSHLEDGADSLQAWLGLGDQLQAPWTDERPVVMTRAELEARAREAGIERDGTVRPGLIADLERVALVRRETASQPPTYLVPSPALLDIALQLEAAGVDIDTATVAQQILRRRLGQAADELVDGFAERTGRGFGRMGEPEDLLESFAALRPLGIQAVQLVFAQEIERALRRFVEAGGALRQADARRRSG